MRILFVTWDGPQVTYLESLFLPIFEGLKSHGFHFDILQFRWGDARQEKGISRACAAAGFGYRAVRVWRWGGSIGPFATAVLGGRHVRSAIRQFNSDLLMTRSVLPSLATLAGRAANLRPVLMDADGLEIDERAEFSGLSSTGIPYRILRDIEAQMVRLSQAVVVRTPATRDILVARAGPPVEPQKFHVVSNGRDESVFHPFDEDARRSVRAELGISPHAPLIVYAGSVGARYRTGSIGEFAVELRKWRPETRLLVLSGSPAAARAELLGSAPEVDAFTTIMRVDPADVPRYVASADVGTALIKSTFSTLGISPVKTGEYLLCGVPVVGTADVGDNSAGLSEGVFFDDKLGLDEAARWVSDVLLPNREAFRDRARRVGLAHFSLERSIRGYRDALSALRQTLVEGGTGGRLS